MPVAVESSFRPVLQAVVMVAVILLLDIRACAQGSDCQYMYTEQPVPHPFCDPYATGHLIIECTVEVPPSDSNISTGWFLNCEQLTNNSDITITSQVQDTTVQRLRSRLRIENLSDRYAGQYTCNLLGDEEFIPSDLFRLLTLSDLIATTGITQQCAPDFIHSKDEEKCAELSENENIPMSLTCTEPVVFSTSSSDITMTSAAAMQITTTPSSTSTPLTLPPSTSSHLLTSSPLPTSTPTLPKDKNESTSRSDGIRIWLYVVAVVAALLLLILIVLVILLTQKCIRQSHRIIHNDLHWGTDRTEVERNLYVASGGSTPSNGRINEVYGDHTASCSTATDALHRRINVVHGIQTQQSEEENEYHNADTPHVYDYIPLDSAGNTTWPPPATNMSGTHTSAGVTNPLSISEV